MDPAIAASVTQPIPAPAVPGSVIADAAFTQYFGCRCSDEGKLRVAGGVAECKEDGDDMHTRLIIAIVLVAVLPQLALGLGILIFVKCVMRIQLAARIPLSVLPSRFALFTCMECEHGSQEHYF